MPPRNSEAFSFIADHFRFMYVYSWLGSVVERSWRMLGS